MPASRSIFTFSSRDGLEIASSSSLGDRTPRAAWRPTRPGASLHGAVEVLVVVRVGRELLTSRDQRFAQIIAISFLAVSSVGVECFEGRLLGVFARLSARPAAPRIAHHDPDQIGDPHVLELPALDHRVRARQAQTEQLRGLLDREERSLGAGPVRALQRGGSSRPQTSGQLSAFAPRRTENKCR